MKTKSYVYSCLDLRKFGIYNIIVVDEEDIV
jgi:hypothetical protein